MTRFNKKVFTNKTRKELEVSIRQYLQAQGFVFEEYRGDLYCPLEKYLPGIPTKQQLALSKKQANGEMVWRKGRGWLGTLKFIKVENKTNFTMIQAWGLAFHNMYITKAPLTFVQERVVWTPPMKKWLNTLKKIIEGNDSSGGKA